MIEINMTEFEYILNNLNISNEIADYLTKAKNQKILLDNEIADILRDVCTGRLDTHGFDSNYNMTPEGEILESLIDKLFTGKS